MDIFSFIGGLSGIIAIGTVVVREVWWKRGVQNDVEDLKKCVNPLEFSGWKQGVTDNINSLKSCIDPQRMGEWNNKIDTLWKISIMDALQKRPDIATAHSPLQLTAEWRSKIPEDVKKRLRDRAKSNDITPGYSELETLGDGTVTELASAYNLTILEMLAVVDLFIEECREGS